MKVTPKPENIVKKIQNWSENYTGIKIAPDLAMYLKKEYPSIEFEINRGGVTLGALIGTTSIEMKTNAGSMLLNELKRDIPCYFDVSTSIIIIVSNPEEGIVEDLRAFLQAKGLTKNVWVIEI